MELDAVYLHRENDGTIYLDLGDEGAPAPFATVKLTEAQVRLLVKQALQVLGPRLWE